MLCDINSRHYSYSISKVNVNGLDANFISSSNVSTSQTPVETAKFQQLLAVIIRILSES